MVATNSLIPALAGALLFFTDLTSAVPAMPIMPHRTIAFRQATASAVPAASPGSGSGSSLRLSASPGFRINSSNSSASLSASSGFPIKSSNSSAGLSASSGFPSQSSNSSNITTTTSYIATETDEAGLVFACTGSLTTQTYTYAGPSGIPVSTQTSFCIGGGVPLTTDSAILNSWNARVSSLAPVAVPKSGCAIGVDKEHGLDTPFCTCAGKGTLPASSVGTILGYSTNPDATITNPKTVTTVCNTGSGSLPTGWVEIPAITDTNDDPIWAQTPSVATTGACANGATLNGNCWGLLELDSYVKWWWGAFKTTCDGYGLGSNFSDCFLKVMTRYDSSKCTILENDAPCPAPQWTDFEPRWNGVRNFYVAWTIYTMATFFLNYYGAIGDASAIASDMVGTIISITDPPKKQNVGLNILLTALSTGLAFIPGPEAYLGKALVIGAQQAPGVAKFLFPEGTINSQTVEMQEVSANLGWTTKTLQNNVAQALPAILNDADTFATFAAAGSFSANLPSARTLSNDILNGLNAYLISQAYQENGVFITRQLNTSVRALMTNGTNLSYNLSCTTDYDSNGICDTFWYDSVDDTTYALVGKDELARTKSYNSDMTTWFNQYTRPELLFRGAANCAAASKANQGTGSPLSISSSDFNTDCLSNMKVCTWSLTPVNGSLGPMFSDCTDKETFLVSSLKIGAECKGTPETCSGIACHNDTPYFRAFRQYLGWGINAPEAKDNDRIFCAGDSPQGDEGNII